MSIEIPKTLDDLPNSSPRWVGRGVPRVEDPHLVTGRTEFIDNVVLPGMLHAAILRSPIAHARIRSVDTSQAEKLAGVFAVVTGEDAKRWSLPSPTMPEEWGTHCMATDKVRYVGEPVAAVAAVNRYVAEDAIELIAVDYEPLEPVADAVKAVGPDGPLVMEEKGTNVMLQRVFTWGEVDEAFADADRVFTEKFRWHRLGANPMETFGVIAQWDPVDESLTLRASVQSALHFGLGRAAVLGLASNKVRVIPHPHGGSFGGKGGTRGCDVAALLTRKAGGRPVKWIEDRSEYLTGGGSQSWDRHYEVSLAVKNDGRVTGLHVKLLDDMGATGEAFGAVNTVKPLACFTGPYAIPVARYDLTLVATNKLPQSPYRGMGPPPHNYVLEQMMDIAARGLDMDLAEIRRVNFIPKGAFPYTIPSGNEYDSGDYEAVLDKALELADYPALRDQQAAARAEGRCVGIGVVSAIEPGVFDWNAYAVVGAQGTGVPEGATVSIDVLGKITIRVGFAMEGQGQYTLATQLVADYFCVGFEDIKVVVLDTHSAPPAFGPGGSRLGVALTGAVLGACERLKAKLVKVAAGLFQMDASQVDLVDGNLVAKDVPGVEMPMAAVAGTMLGRSDLLPPGVDPRPEATYVWTAPGRTEADEQGRAKTYLTAAQAVHVVMVELDEETGLVEILEYCVVDDCGTRLNPATVEGQTEGSIAQGIGAALLEEYVYDDQAQILTSSFMDYLLPTVNEVPAMKKGIVVTPSPFTPLGAKGCGEGAMHTTPAAVLSAINDALLPLGVRANEVPASPNRLWTLIHDAKPQAAGEGPR
ncbi:MAG: carbon monoxide dehydrogenase [Deltaproteobacteria bacterium]|nr:carbon monoxide dehydrogenase [Deltaproteobacteria bacterium]